VYVWIVLNGWEARLGASGCRPPTLTRAPKSPPFPGFPSCFSLTLKRVGLFLDKDVVAHGQVYVGMSRCGDPDKLFVYGNLDANGERWVANPVYREILPNYT
jgi:hypothetical protein